VIRRLVLALAGAALLLAACGPSHVKKYEPKRRQYELPEVAPDGARAGSPGSLYRDGHPATLLFTDARALRVNDLVVVKIEEIADAKRSADTDLARSSETKAAIAEFLGAIKAAKQQVKNLSPEIDATYGSSFRGEGSTGRTERLVATVPAMVRRVLPNGNLFIEGHRVVLVNDEEQHFYLSGVVRPIDIDQENSVKSSMVADAEIEFTGRGVLSDNQQQGWLQRALGWLWPF
jgi:flagellar L-ring protein precursor FlgH